MQKGLIVGAVAVILLAMLVGWYEARPRWQSDSGPDAVAADRRMTFAVLPISAADADKSTAAFASQITDGIIDRQTTSPWSQVVSRESTEDAFRRYSAVKDLGKALNVHFIIRGNVIRRGGNYNTTLSIIDVETDRILASQDFNWPSGRPFNAKNTIFSVDVVGSLAAEAFAVEVRRSKLKKPEDLDVRDLVFLASDAWKHDEASYKIVMPLLQRALAISPDDRAALGVVASVNLSESRLKWSSNPKEQEEIGANAVDRYLRVDGDSQRMLLWKRYLYHIHGRFEDALAIMERLLQKDPDDTESLREKAYDLLKLGRAQEALPLISIVIKEDSQPVNRMLAAAIHYRLGNYAEAAKLSQGAAAELTRQHLASPRLGGILLIRAAAETRLGHVDRAREALNDFWTAVPGAKTVSSIKQWQNPRAELTEYPPFYEDLRRAGIPD